MQDAGRGCHVPLQGKDLVERFREQGGEVVVLGIDRQWPPGAPPPPERRRCARRGSRIERASRTRSRSRALLLFSAWLRASLASASTPDSRCRSTTAVSTLLRCCPPGPLRRVVRISQPARSSSSGKVAGCAASAVMQNSARESPPPRGSIAVTVSASPGRRPVNRRRGNRRPGIPRLRPPGRTARRSLPPAGRLPR